MNALHEDPSSISEPLLDKVEIDFNKKDSNIIKTKIMITPCKHKYHIVCLKKWIDIKLECPTCRKQIPPLD